MTKILIITIFFAAAGCFYSLRETQEERFKITSWGCECKNESSEIKDSKDMHFGPGPQEMEYYND